MRLFFWTNDGGVKFINSDLSDLYLIGGVLVVFFVYNDNFIIPVHCVIFNTLCIVYTHCTYLLSPLVYSFPVIKESITVITSV